MPHADHSNRLLHILAMAAICSTAGNAWAEPVAWRCWDNEDTTLGCRLEAAVVQPWAQEGAGAYAAPSDSAGVDRRGLPPFVRALRDRPSDLAGRTIRIPMHGPLLDPAFARELAQAVMCGSRAACSVQFVSRPEAIVAVSDEALDD